ncbi:hypothetical protein F5Y19DRAFT_487104 [Xylariaceae sp. FL1651]|nr:hypothetical protein F5Y19DRAFT_487104 [Xylariaceae sp. FL1651]
MPRSHEATQGSKPSTRSSSQSYCLSEAMLQSERLERGLAAMNPWTHLENSVDKQKRVNVICDRLKKCDEELTKASRRRKRHSPSSSRPQGLSPGDGYSNDNREKSNSSGTLHSSFTGNTNFAHRPRHVEGPEDAFHERFHAVIRWYQDWLARWASTSGSNQEGGDHRSTVGATSLSCEQSTQQQQRNDKRKCQDRGLPVGGNGNGCGGDDGDGGNNGRDHPPVKKSRDSKYKPGLKLRLACPFFKHNAVRYVDHQYCLHHWPSTSRLKDHLYQQHMLSGIQCGLCGAEFSSQSSFQAHQRELGACEQRDFEPLEGIDALTKMRLQDKKVARGATEEFKWHGIYAILFPDEDPSKYPDPYYYLFPVLRQRVALFLQDEMPSIIQNAINSVTNNVETGTTPNVNELHTAISTSINSCLRRFQPEQEASPPSVLNAEAEVDEPESTQTISQPQDQVLVESSARVVSGSNTAEDLLQQFQADLGEEQTFTNAYEAGLDGFVRNFGSLDEPWTF